MAVGPMAVRLKTILPLSSNTGAAIALTPGTAPDFLALPNVVVCGGSWLTPADAMAAGDWATITQLAREASALARG